MSWVGIDSCRELVPRIARHVIRKHEDDIGVWDPQTFDSAIPIEMQVDKININIRSVSKGRSGRRADIPRTLAICFRRISETN